MVLPWRINRYIIKEILPYFGLMLLVATGLIFAHEVSRFSELFVKRNVPPVLVHTLLTALLMRILVITLPISLLIGIFLGLSRLSSDNEIIVLLGSGLSRKQILIPLVGLSFLVSALMGVLALMELPRSARRFREIRGQLIVQGIRTQIKPRVFDARFADQVLYIRAVNRRTDLWQGIFLASSESGRLVFMTGQSGTLELGSQPEGSELHLFDGVIHRIEQAEDGSEVYHLEGFSSHHVRFNPQSREAEKFKLETQHKPEPVEEKTLAELLTVSPSNHQAYLKARVEAGRRLAIPFACLLFAPLGLAFGILRRPTARSAGFFLSVVLAIAYYLALFAGEKLARAGLVPPLPAMWLGNLLFGLLAVKGLGDRRSLSHWQDLFQKLSHLGRRLTSLIRHRRRPLRKGAGRGIRRRMPTVKLIDQYVVTGFTRFFLLSLISLWLVFMVFTLFELSPDIIEHQIGVMPVAQYFFYLSPQIFQTLTPPCALIASLITIGVLTQTNELTILKASGVSAYRLSLPILAVCLCLLALSSLWQNRIVPTTDRRQDRLRFYIKKGRYPEPIELSPLLTAGNWMYGQEGRIFHFHRFDRRANQFDRLLVLDINESDMTIQRRIEAKRAVWNRDTSSWELTTGQLWTFDGDQLVQSQNFDKLSLRLVETPTYFKRLVKKPGYMSSSELSARIAELEKKGVDVTELRIALERKLAFPLACLVMGLVGIPFGFSVGRKGALFGASIGIILGLVYWFSLGLFGQLGKYGYVSCGLAGWGPDGLFGGLGVYLLFRVRS